jgi:hypothetical protein
MAPPLDYSLWKNDKDWLVTVAMLRAEDHPDNADVLDWIGRLFAFTFMTSTRILSMRGESSWPTYELWFSFHNDSEKRRFLNLVREDGYADPDDPDDGFNPPASLRDLPNLRPMALVFPKHQDAHISAVAEATMAKMMASGISGPWDIVN